MANIIESQVTLEDEVFEETIDVAEEPIDVVRPSSYNDLQDLPQVNGVTLQGNKTSSDLGIVTQNDIDSAVSAEATLREEADTALGGRIDQEITDRSEAEIALGGRIDGEITNRTNADNALGTRIDNEILARQGGDNNLQSQIDAITSKSDVVDVVATYADLQAYDTQHLGNNDVIKVLDDETHDDAQTYYRWNKTAGTWSYIGSEAPYYSKGQMDVMLQGKQDKLTAGANIQIQNGTISATDTTYTAGNGLNLNGTEFSADTDVLATKEDLEDYYTKTEADNLLAPKLEAEVVTELPTTGAEGKLYLTPKPHATQTATGNPIEATITAQAGQLESFQLDGDTFQQSYEGKNLVGIDGITFPFTTNGVTVTREQDGSYTFNGTTTGVTNFVLSPYSNRETYDSLVAYDGQNATLSLATSGTMQATQSTSAPAARNYGIKTWSGDDVFVATNDGTNFSPSRSGTLNMGFYTDAYLGVRVSNGVIMQNFNMKIQLELGSTATSYEPYVGGQPSPSPSYPQPIQTVTGMQTVEIVGKNLFDKDNYNILNCWPTSVLAHGNNWSIWIPCEPNTTYSVTKMICQPTVHNRFKIVTTAVEPNYDVAVVDTVYPGTDNTTGQITTGATAKYLMVVLANTDTAPTTTLSEMLGSVQIEVGSATTYAPYSKQTYQLNLGSIELCKLGAYQDYIYKDGDSWKVHKETIKKAFSNSTEWIWDGTIPRLSVNATTWGIVAPPNTNTPVLGVSNKFKAGPFWYVYNQENNGFAYSASGFVSVVDKSWESEEDARAAFAGTTFYFAAATPTDTTITDTTLISQLEAIRNASLATGTNTITNSAPAPNLAGDMEIGYYGFNPRNRYDKFIWLDLNNNYEQIGGE